MDWNEMDWQARADTGRAIGGQHLPRRPSRHVFDPTEDGKTCIMCGRREEAHPEMLSDEPREYDRLNKSWVIA